MTTALTPASVPTHHTKAWLVFEHNLETISHMVYLGGREIRLLRADASRLNAFLDKKLGDLGTEANTRAVAAMKRSVGRFSKTTDVRLERYRTANLWQVVMLVACVEAYLQDLLSAAASADPKLMDESKQVASYDNVIAATSLTGLANLLCARWARGWLNRGTTRWIRSLKKMGARDYPADLAHRLVLIWDIRHAVVHAGGVADAHFVKQHPGVVKTSGDRLQLNSRHFGAFLVAVRDFMEPTEKLFLKRYPSLAQVSARPPN